MKILVTNDDGILSEGLWTLVKALKEVGQVTVVAPDSEQSAIGTAVTLRQPLEIRKVTCSIPGVEAYSVDGTPSDSVILALGKLIEDGVDVVVSGINLGSNLGEDVHISGTVGAALQGYFRGFPALAVSAPWDNEESLTVAARIAAIIVPRIPAPPQPRLFLNVNLPDVPSAEIAGVRITRLARGSHLNTVEEDDTGRQKVYRLVRRRLDTNHADDTDIQAVEQGHISLTPLYFNRVERPEPQILESLREDLLREMNNGW